MNLDTSGDGSGCDNMTGIIVQLNERSKVNKRPNSDDDVEGGKRTKLE